MQTHYSASIQQKANQNAETVHEITLCAGVLFYEAPLEALTLVSEEHF